MINSLHSRMHNNHINSYNVNKKAISFNGGSKFCIDKGAEILEDAFYKQVDNTIDIDKVKLTLLRRARILPAIMDQLFYNSERYLRQDIGVKSFATKYVDDSVPFYKRLELGANKEEYAKNYKPEISLIKKIGKYCISILDNTCTKSDFDKTVEQELSQYAATDRKFNKHFTS